MNTDIRTYTIEELEEVLTQLGQPKFRSKQLYEWLHTHNATSYDEMTNLPKSLRSSLQEKYPFYKPKIINKQVSKDGTRKYVLELQDKSSVEVVGIPSHFNKSDLIDWNTSDNESSSLSERLTVCFSTQAGCAMGCSFCATGKEGFSRNLTSQEMIDQLIVAQKDFADEFICDRISNVVAMGQGEPFLNYDELIKALRIMNSENGLNIGARHITVSTCGIIDGVYRFAEEPEQFRLAVSLHSAIQETRNKLMPKLSNQPLKRLREALLDYTLKKRRRVTFEYLMIDGVNDRMSDLDALLDFCNGILCHINLIPMNKVNGSSYKPSSQIVMRKWETEINAYGIPASIRYSKGSDISGACGQLKNSFD